MSDLEYDADANADSHDGYAWRRIRKLEADLAAARETLRRIQTSVPEPYAGLSRAICDCGKVWLTNDPSQPCICQVNKLREMLRKFIEKLNYDLIADENWKRQIDEAKQLMEGTMSELPTSKLSLEEVDELQSQLAAAKEMLIKLCDDNGVLRTECTKAKTDLWVAKDALAAIASGYKKEWDAGGDVFTTKLDDVESIRRFAGKALAVLGEIGRP